MLNTACTTTKKSSSTNTVSADTVLQQAVKETQVSNQSSRQTVKTDTTIGVQRKKVEDDIKPQDTEVPRTKDGTAIPRHFSKKENGLTAWVTLFGDGSIKYGAESDSLTLVIRNLEYTKDSLTQMLFVKDSSNYYHASKQATTTETLKIKTRSWLAANWWWMLILVVMGVLAVFAKTYFKR